jgi:hypothetical protein
MSHSSKMVPCPFARQMPINTMNVAYSVIGGTCMRTALETSCARCRKLLNLALGFCPLEASFGGLKKSIGTEQRTKGSQMRWRFHVLVVLNG